SPTTLPNTVTVTSHTPVIAVVILLLVLVVIIVAMIVTLVIRHNKRRNRDPEVIQLTDHQPGLSRQASENSLHESYDNHGATSSNMSDTTSVIDSATTSVINTTYQIRGSAHDTGIWI
ncbi:unnamed protein product, partial [Meganyctiphanes norvegica]